MIFAGLGAIVPAMLLVAAADLDSDTADHYEKIADSVAMVGTCQQHEFEVDVAGIEAWKTKAIAMAVAGGMTETEAEARLEEEIADEYERVEEEFEKAQEMSHSRDHVMRFNRRMKRNCERLAKDDLAGAYFTEG